MFDLVPVPAAAVSPSLSASPSLTISAIEYAAASRAESTLSAYRGDWQQFVSYCGQTGVESLPALPAVVCNWIAVLAATHKPASISRKLAAVAAAHRMAGFDSPTTSEAVKLTMSGVRRTVGVRQRQARPLLVGDLRRIIAVLPADLAGVRDASILLLGFSGGFRRSEIASLGVEDITFVDDGVVVLIRKSKTDQEQQGREVAIPTGSSRATCPVAALRNWIEASGIESGPLYRSIDRHGNLSSAPLTGHSVGLIVKRSAALVGMDGDLFSGHSLRAGLVTAAAEGGANEVAIMNTTGHKSSAMVRKYIRRVEAFRNNAAAATGL